MKGNEGLELLSKWNLLYSSSVTVVVEFFVQDKLTLMASVPLVLHGIFYVCNKFHKVISNPFHILMNI